MFATVSGSHFNPVVTLVDVLTGGRHWGDAAAYIPAQIIGCIGGAVLANLMFGDPAISISTNDRLSPGTFLGEIIATAGLILVIFTLARTGRHPMIAWAVGAYIGAAYFFTSSTSFANPAITIGRMFSDTFAGIAPASAPGFIGAQLLGAALGLGLVVWFTPQPAWLIASRSLSASITGTATTGRELTACGGVGILQRAVHDPFTSHVYGARTHP